MKIFDSLKDLRAELKGSDASLALVPTMGALHEGHLSLVDLARKHARRVGVSIFVNPMQFNNTSDLEHYPRDLEKDVSLLESRNVDYLFTPTVDQLYGVYNGTKVIPSKLGAVMEGPNRPGHFEGVCTVVSILFNIYKPEYAVFGEKDFQQLRVIEDMVSDLSMDIKIIRGETSRERHGLARSSRNERLTPDEREKASCIYEALLTAREMVRSGTKAGDEIIGRSMEVLAVVPELTLEYLSIHREDTLEELSVIDPSVRSRIFFAGYFAGDFGRVRLIDNMVL